MNRYQKHNNISRSYISMSLFRYATKGRDVTAMCLMSIWYGWVIRVEIALHCSPPISAVFGTDARYTLATILHFIYEDMNNKIFFDVTMGGLDGFEFHGVCVCFYSQCKVRLKCFSNEKVKINKHEKRFRERKLCFFAVVFSVVAVLFATHSHDRTARLVKYVWYNGRDGRTVFWCANV